VYNVKHLNDKLEKQALRRANLWTTHKSSMKKF